MTLAPHSHTNLDHTTGIFGACSEYCFHSCCIMTQSTLFATQRFQSGKLAVALARWHRRTRSHGHTQAQAPMTYFPNTRRAVIMMMTPLAVVFAVWGFAQVC